MPIDPIPLLVDLVRADSRNPSLVPGAAGEGAAARTLARTLEQWGFRVALHEARPGRPNVIARIGRGRVARSLMLNGHIDVVGVDGMVHEPFGGERRNGRIYGRGSADMKAGVAAMCAAAARAAGDVGGEIIVAGVVDEEFESAGTRALVAAGIRADAAIVTEPTRLAICPAHKGFVWVEVDIRGRAAHGSRYDLGVDAIRDAALIVAELDRIEREELSNRKHRLLGRASVHASTIAGGTGWSIYPDRCEVRFERRTLPGEPAGAAAAEVERACAAVRSVRPGLDATVRAVFSQEPSDVREDAPIVRALAAALGERRREVRIEGLSAWTDAALLNAAGIPAICFGPGDITLAHAAEEYVPEDEVLAATDVLETLIRQWFR